MSDSNRRIGHAQRLQMHKHLMGRLKGSPRHQRGEKRAGDVLHPKKPQLFLLIYGLIGWGGEDLTRQTCNCLAWPCRLFVTECHAVPQAGTACTISGQPSQICATCWR